MGANDVPRGPVRRGKRDWYERLAALDVQYAAEADRG